MTRITKPYEVLTERVIKELHALEPDMIDMTFMVHIGVAERRVGGWYSFVYVFVFVYLFS